MFGIFVARASAVSVLAESAAIVRTIPPVPSMAAGTVGYVFGGAPANRIGIRGVTPDTRHIRTVSAREIPRAMAVIEGRRPSTGSMAGRALS